jgi:hypothetical protein
MSFTKKLMGRFDLAKWQILQLRTIGAIVVSLYFLFGYALQAAPIALLVTGCGRSGTTYMATFLEKSGYEILHERLGKEGVVSWPMSVDSLSPWGPLSKQSFQHVFHQVKHPLPVLTSWMINLSNLNRDEWVFIRRHVPEIKLSDSLIVHCAKYWYYWNLLAEKKAEWRYRIEDLVDILPEFMQRSGLILDYKVLEQIPSNCNTWLDTRYKLTWNDLKRELPRDLYQKIRDMAYRYGYKS